MNDIKYYLNTLIYNFLLLVLGGSVFQVFLSECKIGEQSIGVYFAIMQVIQMLIMVVFSPVIDRPKNIIRSSAMVFLLGIPITAFGILFCSGVTVSANIKYTVLMVTGGLFSCALGLNTILSYKLPYHIIDMNRYGDIASMGSAIAGIFLVIASFVLSYLQRSCEYFTVMRVFFIICLAMILLNIPIMLSLKKYDSELTRQDDIDKTNIFKYKPFTALIIANLARGFCLGVISIATTIGYHFNIIDVKSASILIIITNLSTIVGALIYPKIVSHIRLNKTILMSSIVLLVTMPAMLILHNTVCYLLFYGISYLIINVINIAVPVAVTKIIDYKVAGRYSAYRMILNAAGTALGSILAISMCSLVGGFVTMLVAGGMQLYSGIKYNKYLSETCDEQKSPSCQAN